MTHWHISGRCSRLLRDAIVDCLCSGQSVPDVVASEIKLDWAEGKGEDAGEDVSVEEVASADTDAGVGMGKASWRGDWRRDSSLTAAAFGENEGGEVTESS